MDHCPNPLCVYHNKELLPKEKWYKKHGFYNNRRGKRVRRYRCINCGTTFTDETEGESWYLHRKDVTSEEVVASYRCGISVPEMAEMYNCSSQLIRTRLERKKRPTIYYKHPLQRLEKILG